jgi:aspartate/methionine/tyrosine aminotransferase
MQLPPFPIEEYYAKHEFSAKYMLSSSDSESRPLADLLAFESDALERLNALWLGYTESVGSLEVRQAVSQIYQHIAPEQSLIVSSAEEGIFVATNVLLSPTDHAIIEMPCFNSAFEVARVTGAEVSMWQRHFEDGWAHDLAVLEGLIRPNTKMIYLCTPHNPLGLVMERDVFDAVLQMAASKGIYVFCDEVFRELEHDPALRLPAACDAYARAISLGSMSKSYGLPGLRLGWYATQDQDFLEQALAFKNYTTICSSAPSELLTALALRHRQVLLKRNLELVQHNLPLLEAFIGRFDHLFSWVKPNGSPMAFPKVALPDVDAFCDQVVRDISVLLLPGSKYDRPQHLRMGVGRKNMPEVLARFESYLLEKGF